MDQRGRKSPAALTAVNGTPPRLQPPASLPAAERAEFIAIVANTEPTHFRPSDLPLLVSYCRAIVLEARAYRELEKAAVTPDGKTSPWVMVAEKATRAIVSLSMRLRLSPQARRPSVPVKVQQQRPLSYYERQRLEEMRDEEDDDS